MVELLRLNKKASMKIKSIYLLFIIALVSCKESSTNTIKKKNDLKIEGLYSFAQTEDQNLCNSDLVIGSDCAGGDIYFSEKNIVLFTFYCQGQDSISYEIGTYDNNDTLINCQFTNSYSYKYDELDTLNQEIYKGVFQTLKQPSTVLIKPIKCSDFPFYLSLKWEGEGEYNYVLKKSDSIERKDFLLEMEKIKPFQRHLQK
jgi:hypothetical protein